jgi:hypothetical protein
MQIYFIINTKETEENMIFNFIRKNIIQTKLF